MAYGMWYGIWYMVYIYAIYKYLSIHFVVKSFYHTNNNNQWTTPT